LIGPVPARVVVGADHDVKSAGSDTIGTKS
jgi:hypothetical protein